MESPLLDFDRHINKVIIIQHVALKQQICNFFQFRMNLTAGVEVFRCAITIAAATMIKQKQLWTAATLLKAGE